MEETLDLLNVLWVDDNESIHMSACMEAKRSPYYLKLVPKTCWEDAETLLTTNYDDFSAIILDAKCKVKKTDPADTLLFLPTVIRRLGELAAQKQRTIPWFVLSAGDGGDSGEVGRLDWTKRDRLAWDDWEGDFYNKETDKPSLFARIRKLANVSNATQIKTILYKDVFEALGSFKGADIVTAKRILVDILEALHFNSNEFKAVLYYNQLRQLVEILFRACNKVGLIPDQCIKDGIVNLNQSSLYLAGKDAKLAGVRYGDSEDRIITPHIEKEIRYILELGNNNSHTVELEDEDKKQMEEFFRTANSKYIVFSLALQMCDIIVWFKDYIAVHNDKEINLSKCTPIESDGRAKYEGKEFLPDKDKDGFWHCDECSVPIRPSDALKKVRLRDVNENTNVKTKDKYKYFAFYDVL